MPIVVDPNLRKTAPKIDDVDQTMDHRIDVPVKSAVPADPIAVQRSKVADNVVAFVLKDALEPPSGPAPTPLPSEYFNAYWTVKSPYADKTDSTPLVDRTRNVIRAHLAACKDSIKEMINSSSAKDTDKTNANAQIDALDLGDPLTMEAKIAPGQKSKLVLGQGSGVMIAKDRVLTCAHIDPQVTATGQKRFSDDPSKYRVLFDYRQGDIRNGQKLPCWQVREIQSVDLISNNEQYDFNDDQDNIFDLAILQLMPLPKGAPAGPNSRVTCSISPERATAASIFKQQADKLYCVGCPLAVPLVMSDGIVTRDATFQMDKFEKKFPVKNTYFSTNLELQRGNSGGPVFEAKDGQNVITGIVSAMGTERNYILANESTTYDSTVLLRDVRKAAEAILKNIFKVPFSPAVKFELIKLFYSPAHGTLINNDKKSFTWAKMWADDPTLTTINLCSRVDPLAHILRPLNQLTPFTAYNMSISVAFRVDFDETHGVDDLTEDITLGLFDASENITTKTAIPKDGKPRTFYFTGGAGIYDNFDLASNMLRLPRLGAPPKNSNASYRLSTPMSKETVANILKHQTFNGVPGLLGLNESDSIRLTRKQWNIFETSPKGGLVCVALTRPKDGSGWPDETYYFQGRLKWRGSCGSTDWFGRVSRWIGPVLDSNTQLAPF